MPQLTLWERFERDGNLEKKRVLEYWQAMPYELKKAHARDLVHEFYRNEEIGGNCSISVGGLDSITLLLFIRYLGFTADEVPAVSVSSLEDRSIQRVHRALGVIALKPIKSKKKVIEEYGYPILSKSIANKINLLQNPSDNNKTVRHAIITGETGHYGGDKKDSKMRLAKKWLNLFGGADAEGAALGYQAAPFKVSDKCCFYLKEKPANDYQKATGRFPFMGLMASEGGRREFTLKYYGCNYISSTTKRSCPFACFMRDDILKLALEMDEWYKVHWQEINPNPEAKVETIIPEIYGEIQTDQEGHLFTTKAQRTGCSMCAFGVHMEKRPNRYDRLYQSNPKEWEYYMYTLGFGKVLDYIGVGWRQEGQQISVFDRR